MDNLEQQPSAVPAIGASEKMMNVLIYTGFAFSGAAALIYEVAWTRKMSTILGSSTYAMSMILAAFMMGLSIGGFAGGQISKRIKNCRTGFALAEFGIGLAGIVTLVTMDNLSTLYIDAYYKYHLSFGVFSAVLFCIVLTVLLVPTTLMGMTFPLVLKSLTCHQEDLGVSTGIAYGVNTLGAVAGSVASGFLLIPFLGVKGTVVLAACLNVATALAILGISRKAKLAITCALLAATAIPAIASQPSAVPFFNNYIATRFPSAEVAKKIQEFTRKNGDKLVAFHEEGIDSEVYLMSTPNDTGLILWNNGKIEGGDRTGFALLGYLPSFTVAKENPEQALNIGLGSGKTLTALADMPFSSVDSVELSQAVLNANRLFLSPELFSNPKVKHIVADGRNYMLVNKPYDVVVASPSWAVELASAGLYTDEFFALAASRITEKGAFGIMVDLEAIPDNDVDLIVRTFSRHFHLTAWSAAGNIILVGTKGAPSSTPDEVAGRILKIRPDLKGVFRLAMTDQEARQAYAAGGTINTDDLSIIEFHNAKNIVKGSRYVESVSAQIKDSRWGKFRPGAQSNAAMPAGMPAGIM
jgi:spermidine synthase